MCLVTHTYDKISKYPSSSLPTTVDKAVVMQTSSGQMTITLKLYVKINHLWCPLYCVLVFCYDTPLTPTSSYLRSRSTHTSPVSETTRRSSDITIPTLLDDDDSDEMEESTNKSSVVKRDFSKVCTYLPCVCDCSSACMRLNI